jgi:ABC-type Na+ efflux pump permease subunit
MRMHKVLTIARRDYVATVRTKAFVFGLVVAPICLAAGPSACRCSRANRT